MTPAGLKLRAGDPFSRGQSRLNEYRILVGRKFSSGPEGLEEIHSMVVGKVVGSIVSTRKSERLIGNKFMIVEPLEEMSAGRGRFVAIDNIGAGIGETVLVAMGSAARVGMENVPVDAAIVGIVDE